MLQITAVIGVQDKWERWTCEKKLHLCCFFLIKSSLNPFIIITYSTHHISLTYLAPGAYDYRMQIGNIPTLLIMQCADVHTHLHPPCPLCTCSISLTHAGLPISPWLTSKRTPIPLKVPFSLVLMADRLWPHSLSAAASSHCVPLSESSMWVEDRLALQSECLTWMYGLGVYPLSELNYHPPAIPCCHMHPSRREGKREREKETRTESTCGTRMPV